MILALEQIRIITLKEWQVYGWKNNVQDAI